jgi:hypothetical protein
VQKIPAPSAMKNVVLFVAYDVSMTNMLETTIRMDKRTRRSLYAIVWRNGFASPFFLIRMRPMAAIMSNMGIYA